MLRFVAVIALARIPRQDTPPLMGPPAYANLSRIVLRDMESLVDFLAERAGMSRYDVQQLPGILADYQTGTHHEYSSLFRFPPPTSR